MNTMRYFCQNCRREIAREDRRIIRIEDNNAFNKKTLHRVQVCTECLKTTEQYMKNIEGRAAWANSAWANSKIPIR